MYYVSIMYGGEIYLQHIPCFHLRLQTRQLRLEKWTSEGERVPQMHKSY